jgi:hypothetical protein
MELTVKRKRSPTYRRRKIVRVVADMPLQRKIPPLGRYSLARVIEEIEEQFTRRGRRSRKDLAIALGFGAQSAINKRQDDDEAHWNIEDLGRVAEAWNAPTGWPFIPWDEAFERDEAWKKRKGGK